MEVPVTSYLPVESSEKSIMVISARDGFSSEAQNGDF